MTLADLMRTADKELEPARNQLVVTGGREVLMLACLDKTAVLVIAGERRVVPLHLIEVIDVEALRWQKKPPTDRASFIARMAGHRKPGAGPR